MFENESRINTSFSVFRLLIDFRFIVKRFLFVLVAVV